MAAVACRAQQIPAKNASSEVLSPSKLASELDGTGYRNS